MKILFPYMARWFAENWTRYHSLLEQIGKLGYEVHIMQPPSMGSKETNFREIEKREMENIIFHDVHLNKWLWNTKLPFNKIIKKAYYSLASMKQAKKIIDDHDIDIVLIYNIPQYFYIKYKNDDTKVIFDYADDYIDMLSYELGKLNIKPIRLLATYLLDKMLLTSNVVLSVSNELAMNTVGNVKVLPNGVDDKFILSSDEKSRSVNNDYVIGFIGSFEYFIDFDQIIKAAVMLPDCKFLLVGYGRDYDMVKYLIEINNLNNVELTGGVPHDEIFSYLDRMDVCLNIFKSLPVSHRACPIKLFEYLGRNKPVISTRLKELEYIDSSSFIYYADSAEEIVEQVNIIRNNYDSAIEKAFRGNSVVRDQYTWKKIATKFIDMTN